MITTEEANKGMLDFIERNISGIDNLVKEGQTFHVSKGDIEFLLITTTGAIKPAAKFVDELKKKGKEGTPIAVLSLRSTSNYEGELLRPAVYVVDGKNKSWRNKKDLTTFEQALIELYGPLPYYNPSKECIHVIRFIRTVLIPDDIRRLESSENPSERQKFHIYESLRGKRRKISIIETIEGPFTLEPYERQKKPLVARIISYKS